MNLNETRTCWNCQGRGEIRSWLFLKKECPICLGMGVIAAPELKLMNPTFRAKAINPAAAEPTKSTQPSHRS